MAGEFAPFSRYKSVKQSDGTYTIYGSEFGLSWEIVETGVRGCNVDRVINRLYLDYLYERDTA